MVYKLFFARFKVALSLIFTLNLYFKPNFGDCFRIDPVFLIMCFIKICVYEQRNHDNRR